MAEMPPSEKLQRQVAALPVRRGQGGLEVLLITSRETGRWIVPKGWLKKGTAAHVMAAREAFEEAGLLGRGAKRPIATYTYAKRLSATETVRCEVRVFLFEVEGQAEDWPERRQRRQCWLSPEAAARVVSEAGLAVLLQRFAATSTKSGRWAVGSRPRAKARRRRPKGGEKGGGAETRSHAAAENVGRTSLASGPAVP